MKILVCFEMETETGGKATGDSVVECNVFTEKSVEQMREYLLKSASEKFPEYGYKNMVFRSITKLDE